MNEKSELDEIKDRLCRLEERMTQLENSIRAPGQPVTADVTNEKEVDGGEGFLRLAQRFGTTVNRIQSLYDVDGSSLTLTTLPHISDLEQKSQESSLAILIGYKYLMSQEEVPATELRRNLAEHGISLANFATYLNGIVPSLVRRKGKPKSPKTTYKLTVPGESKAGEVLGQLLKESKL